MPQYKNNQATPSHPSSGVRNALLSKVLIVLSTLLRASSTLALLPLSLHHLGCERYALWVTVCTVTMYLSLAEAGLGQTVVNDIGTAFARKNFDLVSRIMATAFGVYCSIVLSISIAATATILSLPVTELLLPDNVPQAYHEILRSGLAVACVLTLSRIPLLVYPGLLTGVQKLPLRIGWEIAGTIGAMLATVVVLRAGGGVLALAIAVNLALLLSNVATIFSSRRCGSWARVRLKNFDPRLLGSMFGNTAFFFMISLTGVADRSLPLLMAPRFVPLQAVPGLFLVISIFRVAGHSLISAIPRAVQPYTLAWAATGRMERVIETAQLLTKAVVIASATGVATLAPFSEAIVNNWLGYAGYPGHMVFWLVAGAFLVESLMCVSCLTLMAISRHRGLAVVLLVKTVLTALLSFGFILIPIEPLVAFAAAPLATSILSLVALPSLMRGGVGLRKQEFVTGFVARPIAFTALILPLTLGVAAWSNNGYRVAAVSIVALATTCSACGWVLTPIERGLLLRTLSSLTHSMKNVDQIRDESKRPLQV